MSSSKTTAPRRCLNCGHSVRRKGEKAADSPGTLAYAARGLCYTCFRADESGREARRIEAARLEARATADRRSLDLWLNRRRARLATPLSWGGDLT